MKLGPPRTWGITTRLVLVATVPAFLMFVAVNISLYVSGQDEARQTIRERGQLIAAALAETSQYGVVSGNLSYLERNVRQLLKTDRSIAAIEILDAERKPIVVASGRALEGAYVFERPIGAEVPDIDLFDQGGPHVSLPPGVPTTFRPGPTAGFVRVSMSPAPILAQQRRRLYVGGLLVLAATLLSGAAGLGLAQRLRAPLGAVMDALRRIRHGDYDVRLHTRASGELGELQDTIAEMALGLSHKRQELENQVTSRTRDLQRAVELVSQADAEKRRLIARTHALLEEERQRIAAEIHDDLNASLIVVNLKAQHIASLAEPSTGDATATEIERTALDISDTTRSLYAAARRIVKRLRPEVIDTLGLQGAVREIIRSYDELHPDCRFSLDVAEDFPDLRGELAITCYRLVQEALSNVVKHAGATRAAVRLARHESPPLLLIDVTDNGQGFDPAMPMHDRLGLIGMRERVSAAGGSISIESARHKGTTLSIRLPLPAG